MICFHLHHSFGFFFPLVGEMRLLLSLLHHKSINVAVLPPYRYVCPRHNTPHSVWQCNGIESLADAEAVVKEGLHHHAVRRSKSINFEPIRMGTKYVLDKTKYKQTHQMSVTYSSRKYFHLNVFLIYSFRSISFSLIYKFPCLILVTGKLDHFLFQKQRFSRRDLHFGFSCLHWITVLTCLVFTCVGVWGIYVEVLGYFVIQYNIWVRDSETVSYPLS